MDQGLVSVLIAVITAIAGFVSLQNKAGVSQVDRLDKAQTDAINNVQEYAETLEKQIVKLTEREGRLTDRMEKLELQVEKCHKEKTEFFQELVRLRKRLSKEELSEG